MRVEHYEVRLAVVGERERGGGGVGLVEDEEVVELIGGGSSGGSWSWGM